METSDNLMGKDACESSVGEGFPETRPAAVSNAPTIDLKVTHNKKAIDVAIAADQTVADLKERLATLTGIPADKQKIMWSKGGCADNMVNFAGAKWMSGIDEHVA